jgi:hypothetical protein
MPKSANLTRPFGSTRMFAPLISLKRKARFLSRKKKLRNSKRILTMVKMSK